MNRNYIIFPDIYPLGSSSSTTPAFYPWVFSAMPLDAVGLKKLGLGDVLKILLHIFWKFNKMPIWNLLLLEFICLVLLETWAENMVAMVSAND